MEKEKKKPFGSRKKFRLLKKRICVGTLILH